MRLTLVRDGERRPNRKEAQTMTQTTDTTAQGLPQLRGDLPLPLRSLLDAGVHFGHQTKRWNPKMRPFIYGARNGIHIIDLDQTARLFARAYNFVVDTVGRGGHILMVGTKRQAQEIVREEATRSAQLLRRQPLAGRHAHQLPDDQDGPRAHAPARAHEGRRDVPVGHEEGSLAPREGARALREVPRRSEEHGLAPGRDVRHRPGQGDHRRSRGEQDRHPGHRDHGHQLRSGQDQLRHPGQRRRDPLDQAHHGPHRRCGHRRLAAAQGDRGPRRRIRAAGAWRRSAGGGHPRWPRAPRRQRRSPELTRADVR